MAVTPNRGYVYPDQFADDWWATWVALMNSLDADAATLYSLLPFSRGFDTGKTSGATIALSHTVATGTKVMLFINGVFYTHGVDFSVAVNVITFIAGIPDSNMPYCAIYQF